MVRAPADRCRFSGQPLSCVSAIYYLGVVRYAYGLWLELRRLPPIMGFVGSEGHRAGTFLA